MNQQNFPDTLIIELREELQDFKRVVSDINLPVIDIDAAMQLVIDSLRNLKYYEMKLESVALEINNGESLFEVDVYDDDYRMVVYEAVLKLGSQVKNKLVQLNAYSEDYFPYILRRILNASDVILTRQVT